MKKYLLDSSVWLSALLKDRNSEEAKIMLQNIKSGKGQVILPCTIISEITNVLSRNKFTKMQVLEMFISIISSQSVKAIYPDEKFWFRNVLYISQIVSLKTSDLIVLAFAQRYNSAKLITFDKKLKKAYNKLKNYEKD